MPEATAALPPKQAPAQWGLWAAVIYSVVLLLIFHQTVASMVATWIRSETFAHGFLILPISLWLVWDKRAILAGFSPRPTYAVTLLALPLGFGWLVAWLVDVLVVQQLALVGMLITGVWAILGHKMARVLAFPLGFLFFAVPMGEALIAPMMEFTATSTVWMINQTGIPVFREGMYFTLPSGNWSVVEACSGVRYLIASVTLGVLYAHLNYRSAWRWSLFVLASIVVPVLANTVRAFIIVMLGHFSNMTIATGVDHLVYGWVFFGVVMLLLFWAGSMFREDMTDASSASDLVSPSADDSQGPPTVGLWSVSLVALLVAAVWPLLSTAMDSNAVFTGEPFELKSVKGVWQPEQEAPWSWTPSTSVNQQNEAYFSEENTTVGVFVQYASLADDRVDVVGSISRFVEYRSEHRAIAENRRVLQLPQGDLPVVEAIINSRGEQYMAWSWYRIGSRNFNDNYLAKFQQVLSSLGLGGAGSYRLVLATPIGSEGQAAGRQVLRGFVEENLSEIERRIDQTGNGG